MATGGGRGAKVRNRNRISAQFGTGLGTKAKEMNRQRQL